MELSPALGLLLADVFGRGLPVDNSLQKVCNRGGCTRSAFIERPPCLRSPSASPAPSPSSSGSTVTSRRWLGTAQQSRQSLYREAAQVIDAVDGTAAQARVADLEQQVTRLRGQVQDLQERLARAVEMTPEKPAEVACVAQAEGVSLPVARRILRVLVPPKARSVPTLGRATAEAGRRAGRLPEVLDGAASPRVARATADEIL